MCAPKSNSYRAWKGLFLAAEAFALFGCLYALTWFFSYHFYSKNHIPWATDHISVGLIRFCEQWLHPMLYSFVAASFVLLIVSPFFMFSMPLRPTAVNAWSIGALALVCVEYIV